MSDEYGWNQDMGMQSPKHPMDGSRHECTLNKDSMDQGYEWKHEQSWM